MAETVHQETPGTAAVPQAERTFTQAEMNAIIADRLSRERTKYADYDDLKAKAAKYDEVEEAGKTELQKAQSRADALQKEVDAYKQANTLREVRQKVAQQTGVPETLLTADTEEACTAQAQAILAFAKPAGYPAVPDGGEPTHPSTGSTREQFAEWAQKMFM